MQNNNQQLQQLLLQTKTILLIGFAGGESFEVPRE